MRATENASSTERELDALYAGLSGRPTPEMALCRIDRLIGASLAPRDRALVDRLLRPGWPGYAYVPDEGSDSLMATSFACAASIDKQAQVLAGLIGYPAARVSFDSSAHLEALLALARATLGMAAGRTDFKADRLNRRDRKAAGLDLSRRRYDKLFRATAHLEALRVERAEVGAITELARFAKTSYSAMIGRERFGRDLNTACFVAYLAANLGRRSIFTNGTQARGFDEIAAMLFARLEISPSTDWLSVAQVFPRADVLERVSVAERAELLEQTLRILSDTAARLEALAIKDNINTATMIVGRSADSSTWNGLAGAWNRARDYWISLVYSLGAEAMFEDFLPGKVLRLIAADVAVWHRISGDKLHDDTPIWADLPRPWEVMAGRAVCNLALIAQVCAAHGVDPQRTGWSAPRPRTSVDASRPTPETVHGVIVSSPELAAFLRKIDAFSGKRLKLSSLAGL